MTAALLTAFLFAVSAIFGGKSVRIFGPARANLGRVIVALFCLGLWAGTFGRGLQGAGFFWLVLSGAVGFGFGDLALFGALPRIGPRLSVLLTQCLGGPIAGLVEWLWLGQKISAGELLATGVVLTGVVAALLPGRNPIKNPGHYGLGITFGILSALGQGLGAVITRKAVAVNQLAGTPIDGGTAAFQRMLGGFVVTVVCFFLLQSLRKAVETNAGRWLQPGWHLLLLNGLIGPCIGVGFFQFALTTAPSAIVLAIVATSPVVVMLLQMAAGEERPGAIPIVGALLAVAGAILLALTRN